MEAIAEFARTHGLALERDPAVRELTPALIGGEVPELARGRLAPGLDGELFERGGSTIVLTEVPETAGYVPALVCRDRAALGAGDPVQLPTERWQPVELESATFERRFRLLVLAGQDPGYVRELFSSSLIAWLAIEAPAGISFELNERHLAVIMPGRLETAELEALCAAAAELSRRIREEATEEGDDPDLFDESEERAAVDRAVAEVDWDEPPADVGSAVEAYRAVAARRPSVIAISAALAALAAAVAGGIAALIVDPIVGVIVGATAAVGAFRIARLVVSSRYRFDGIIVARVGLDAFVHEYARSRSLELRNRWRFHSEHRRLPLPGFADHVLADPADAPRERLFVMLGDAAELRSRGEEMAYTSERPLASDALVAAIDPPPDRGAIEGLELPAGWHAGVGGGEVVVWRPIAGNLLRSAAGCDEFRARAGEVLDRLARS